MLFQVVHTHTNETCPGKSPEQARKFADWWQSVKKMPGVKVLAGYVSPMDHTFYITAEADDYPTLAQAFGPLNTYGTGRTFPLLTLDQTLPMAEEGAFRAAK